MYWFILSLGSALSKSLADVNSKRIMAKMGEIAVGCVARGMVALIALIIVLWQGIPTIGPEFLKAALISGVINVATTFLMLRALTMMNTKKRRKRCWGFCPKRIIS